jgi:hypothetical protein
MAGVPDPDSQKEKAANEYVSELSDDGFPKRNPQQNTMPVSDEDDDGFPKAGRVQREFDL